MEADPHSIDQLIPLDAIEWSHLEHAYGPASDVPQLLEQLTRNPGPKPNYRDEPWFTLWSSLCHQGDVYTASYAAIPYLVRIGLASKGPIDFGFFQLPACIEIARARGRGPALPPQLARGYRLALDGLHKCAAVHAADDWNEEMALCVAGALAAAKGQIRAAEAILNLDSETMDRIVAGNF